MNKQTETKEPAEVYFWGVGVGRVLEETINSPIFVNCVKCGTMLSTIGQRARGRCSLCVMLPEDK